jgi:hypothetical protein
MAQGRHARPIPDRVNAMRCSRLLPLVLVALLAISTASAQPTPPGRSQWLGGGGVLVGIPRGDFADATDTGVGLSGHVIFTPTRGPFGLRLQMGGLIYGSRDARVTIPGSGGLITEDLSINNWLLDCGIGPQVMVRSGSVRPYAYATAGLGYFATETTLGHDAEGSFSSTNYDDATFAWSAGVGLLIPLSGTVAIDLGVQYVGNGTVRYLAEGDLRPSPGGAPPVIIPRRTEANLVEITIGVTFGR